MSFGTILLGLVISGISVGHMYTQEMGWLVIGSGLVLCGILNKYFKEGL